VNGNVKSTSTTTTTTTRDRGDRHGPIEWAQLACFRSYSAALCSSATWRRRDNIHSFGGAPVDTASCGSEAGCLSCCAVDPHCTAVDVDMRSLPARCYVYSRPDAVRFRVPLRGVNQFELVSRGDCVAGPCTSVSDTHAESYSFKLAFHGADTDNDTDADFLADIIARIVARMSACR